MVLKTAFVVSETGGSAWEICLVVCTPAFALLGRNALWAPPLLHPAPWSRMARFVADVVTIVMPTVVAPLCSPDKALLFCGACLGTAAWRRGTIRRTPQLELAHLNEAHPVALTNLRALVMLQTVFCILAVDYPIFPRRFAKTHTWGHSLMDLGVGAVMLTGALVRRRASAKPARLSESAWRVCRRHAPLVAIGAGRLIAVKAADYHEVVSEYGTHWNFFFTLALVAAAAAVATPASARATALCAAALLLLHQAALLCGIAQWVEHTPRRGLLSANKEGLASLPGYLAIWWLGDAIGAVLRPRAAARSWWRALAELGLLTLVLGAASFIADATVQRASRRLCNLAYSLWVVAQTLLVLCICLGTSLVCPGPAPELLDALNRHLLGVFLLANLLTGAVNLTLPTMHASGPFGLCVLCVYMVAVCAAACAAEGSKEKAVHGLR